MNKSPAKRKNKSTSFDLTDSYERRLLEYAEQKSNGKYSRYIKRLIERDMDNLVRKAPPSSGFPIPDDFIGSDDDKIKMSNFI